MAYTTTTNQEASVSKSIFVLIILFAIGWSKLDTQIGEDLNEKLTEYHNVELDFR